MNTTAARPLVVVPSSSSDAATTTDPDASSFHLMMEQEGDDDRAAANNPNANNDDDDEAPLIYVIEPVKGGDGEASDDDLLLLRKVGSSRPTPKYDTQDVDAILVAAPYWLVGLALCMMLVPLTFFWTQPHYEYGFNGTYILGRRVYFTLISSLPGIFTLCFLLWLHGKYTNTLRLRSRLLSLPPLLDVQVLRHFCALTVASIYTFGNQTALFAAILVFCLVFLADLCDMVWRELDYFGREITNEETASRQQRGGLRNLSTEMATPGEVRVEDSAEQDDNSSGVYDDLRDLLHTIPQYVVRNR